MTLRKTKKVDPAEIVPEIAKLIVKGQGEDSKKSIQARYGLTKKDVEKYYTAALDSISLAAVADRTKALALAQKQYELIVTTSIESGDLPTALRARDSLTKLLRLTEVVQVQAIAEEAEGATSEDTELTRSYLESLGVLEKGLPLPELARQLVAFVLDNINPELLGE